MNLGATSSAHVFVFRVGNEAGTDCGGICLSGHSFLNATSLFIKLNSAKDTAGAVGIFSSSSFLCYSCLFELNTALDGAGIYVKSTNETQHVAAQLQDCLFVNNSASLSGGICHSCFELVLEAFSRL